MPNSINMEKLDNPTQEQFWQLWVDEALALGCILHYTPEKDMDSFQLFDGLSYQWFEDTIIHEGTSREADKRTYYTDKLLRTTNYTPDGVIIWSPKVKNIPIFLNFPLLLSSFLCLDQPIVIKAIAIIFINGCSIEVSLKAASFIFPAESKPKGEIK